MKHNHLNIAAAQIAPVWCDREATLGKVLEATREAAEKGADLVAFGEALLPGYPFWLSLTDGAKFDDDRQKALFAHYADAAIVIEDGHLERLQNLAHPCRVSLR